MGKWGRGCNLLITRIAYPVNGQSLHSGCATHKTCLPCFFLLTNPDAASSWIWKLTVGWRSLVSFTNCPTVIGFPSESSFW